MKIRQVLNRLEYIINKVDNKQYANYILLSNDLTSLYNDISIGELLERQKKQLQPEKQLKKVKEQIQELEEREKNEII